MSTENNAAAPPASSNYKDFWNAKAQTVTGAMIAVDGSADEDVLRLTGAYTKRQVELALQLQPGDRVFEIGCGVGRIGREIAPGVAAWHGLDIADNMVAVTRERLAAYPNVSASALTRSRPDPLDGRGDTSRCDRRHDHVQSRGHPGDLLARHDHAVSR